VSQDSELVQCVPLKDQKKFSLAQHFLKTLYEIFFMVLNIKKHVLAVFAYDSYSAKDD
jgi:hypothetical protein